MPPVKQKLPTAVSSSQEQPVGRWVKKRITITVETRGILHPRDVDAEVLGLVAVHPNVENPTWTSITALTIRLQLLSVGDAETAKRAAELLWSECGPCLRQKSRDAMIASFDRLFPWVRPWVRACHEAKAWQEPSDFGRRQP